MTHMLPGLPPLPNNRDIVLVAEPGREVVEIQTDDERVLFVMEPVTLSGGGVGGGAVDSVNGQTGVVVLDKDDIGLGLVDNTPDTGKPLSAAMVTALNGKADTTHAHSISQVTGLDNQLEVLGDELDNLGVAFDALEDALDSKAPLGEQESYGPTGSGLGEWTCDPLLCSTHFATSSGTLVLVRHRIRKAMSIDEIGFVLQQAGVTPGAYSGVAVYADGIGVVNRLAQSADMGAVFTSTGAKSLPLTAPSAVGAGEFRWIGYLWQGTSPPRLFAPPGPPDGSMMNVGRRRTVFLAGQTGFPATLDIAAMTPNTTTYWFSLKDV